MTIRTLPEIKAFDELAGLTFEPDQNALARWNAGIRAAEADDDATISIYDVIGQDMWTGEGVTSKRIAGALRKIGAREVTVNINSPGGDFFEGVGIYSLLREHPAKVTIKVMGLAASAASVIAMAGDTIQIAEPGFLMVHNAWAIAIGNRHDMRAASEMLEPFDDAMAGLYAARANVKKAKASEWMDAETWFNGSKAVEAGLADALLPAAEVKEKDSKDAKSLAAVRRVETALARQGLPRHERRSLIGEIAGRPAVADAQRPAVAGALSAAEIRRITELFKP